MKPKVGGILPSPRHGHAAVYDEAAARIVLYGGCTYTPAGHPRYENDTRELDLRSMTWQRARVKGEYPAGRYWHATAVLSNVAVFMGGWSGARDSAAAAATATAAAGEITIPYQPGMGHAVPAEADAVITVPYGVQADTYFFDLDGSEFVHPSIAGKPPGYRYGCSMATAGLRMVIFGGWEDSRALYETLVLDMSALVGGGGGADGGEGGEAAAGAARSEEEAAAAVGGRAGVATGAGGP
jgi:hypothetical protein